MNLLTCSHHNCIVVFDPYIRTSCPLCNAEKEIKELRVELDKIEEAKSADKEPEQRKNWTQNIVS